MTNNKYAVWLFLLPLLICGSAVAENLTVTAYANGQRGGTANNPVVVQEGAPVHFTVKFDGDCPDQFNKSSQQWYGNVNTGMVSTEPPAACAPGGTPLEVTWAPTYTGNLRATYAIDFETSESPYYTRITTTVFFRVVKQIVRPTPTFNAVEPDTPTGQEDTGPIKTKIAGTGIKLKIVALDHLNNNATFQLWLLEPGGGGKCGGGWSRVELLTASPMNYNGSPVTRTFASYGGALSRARIEIAAQNGNDSSDSCSTDKFAIRPAYFAVMATDQNRTTAGTGRTLDATTATGTPVHNAGRPFTLSIEPRNATGVKTPNYVVGTPNITVVGSALGANPGALRAGSWATVNGDAVSNKATYSEAGAVELQITDANFAAVDAIDGTPLCQRTIGLKCVNGTSQYWTSDNKIGRFVPDHFAVTLNKPSFATGCGAGQFTYIGKAFKFATSPVITVTAQNFQNDTTTNYTGNLVKLKNDANSVSGRSYADAGAPADAPLDVAGLPTSGDPQIVGNGDGTATLTFLSGTGLDYQHGKPVAPFNSLIDLSINVKDLDGVAVGSINGAPGANPVTFNDISFDNGSQMRYGRVFINSAVGSELLDLPMEMIAEYYKDDETGFVKNVDDTCTSAIAKSDIDLTHFQAYDGGSFSNSVASFDKLAESIAKPGDFGLILSKPPNGKQGTVNVTADVPTWLQYDWDGNGAYDNNPSGRATFGIFKGSPHRLYQREVVGPGG